MINFLVAVAANSRNKTGDIRTVTVYAGKDLSITALEVRSQRVTSGIMREGSRGHIRQYPSRSLVLAVTGAARQGIIFNHQGVRGCRVSQLAGNFSMANHAAIALRIFFPGRRVTAGTIIPNFGMRANPLDALSSIGIKTTSREHPAAGKKGVAPNHEHG